MTGDTDEAGSVYFRFWKISEKTTISMSSLFFGGARVF